MGTGVYFAKSRSFVLVISSRSRYKSGRSTSSYSLSGSGLDTCEGSATRTGPATRSTSSPTSSWSTSTRIGDFTLLLLLLFNFSFLSYQTVPCNFVEHFKCALFHSIELFVLQVKNPCNLLLLLMFHLVWKSSK